MGTPSAGGALLPYQDQDFKKNVTVEGTTTTNGALVTNGALTVNGGLSMTTSPTTSANVGAAATGVTAVEYGNGINHQTVLSFTALAMALSDTNVGGGTLLYTFPVGNISVLAGLASVAETTTSTLASTLNAGVTLSVGVGSVQTTTQGSGTLVTTQQDLVNAFSATSSATINVAGAVAKGKVTATTLLRFDGTSSAITAYLNCGVPTGTDIDGDATTTWTGTVTLTWVYDGTT